MQPLLLGSKAFSWEKLVRLIQDSETPCVAEQQDHHNNPHLEYPDTERNSGVSKCLPPAQKKKRPPQENALEKMSDSHREDFT